ncbi:antitoxin VbhA family protein [Nocardia sp. alder85J]|uniref:antitoxin VbhA family protein n=1 Tax=Nocardia sp. alder85J TaxID=2862949 RepID=UPI001CD5D4FD
MRGGARGAVPVPCLRGALASVRAEGSEPTPDLIAQRERLVSGEITVDEAYEEALRRHRRR